MGMTDNKKKFLTENLKLNRISTVQECDATMPIKWQMPGAKKLIMDN
jgi:hypothetical protein